MGFYNRLKLSPALHLEGRKRCPLGDWTGVSVLWSLHKWCTNLKGAEDKKVFIDRQTWCNQISLMRSRVGREGESATPQNSRHWYCLDLIYYFSYHIRKLWVLHKNTCCWGVRSDAQIEMLYFHVKYTNSLPLVSDRYLKKLSPHELIPVWRLRFNATWKGLPETHLSGLQYTSDSDGWSRHKKGVNPVVILGSRVGSKSCSAIHPCDHPAPLKALPHWPIGARVAGPTRQACRW